MLGMAGEPVILVLGKRKQGDQKLKASFECSPVSGQSEFQATLSSLSLACKRGEGLLT